MFDIKCPFVAVDVIVEINDKIVLISRKNPPYGWAIPGGFVDYGEKLEDAAIREIKEEISLDVELVTLLGVYSDPERDKRLHAASAVYIGVSDGTPVAADDAKEAKLFSVDDLPTMVFDHSLILNDYIKYKASKELPPPRPS